MRLRTSNRRTITIIIRPINYTANTIEFICTNIALPENWFAHNKNNTTAPETAAAVPVAEGALCERRRKLREQDTT